MLFWVVFSMLYIWGIGLFVGCFISMVYNYIMMKAYYEGAIAVVEEIYDGNVVSVDYSEISE